MLIPRQFDEANSDRRKIVKNNSYSTAKKLNSRMKNFMKDIEKSHSLTKFQKVRIREILLSDL